jgi:hypothetical protein
MNKVEVVNMLIKLLELPEGQRWVTISDLIELAEKVDEPKK